jgi:hypothetical protein
MQANRLIGGSLVLSKAGLTGLSGAATTYSIGNAVTYGLSGKAYSKSTVAGGATPTTDALTGLAFSVKPGYGTNVLWCLDAAGNVVVVQGSTEQLNAAGNFSVAPPQFAQVPDTLVPFAYSVIKNVSTGTLFTFGTSLWNQAGVTVTAQDIFAIPNRPQVA